MNEQEIYISAMNRQDPDERQQFIQEACGDDVALRERVEKLIRHSDQVGNPPQALSTAVALPRIAETVGTVIGPYTLREQIGEGGMGVVFVAEQTEPVRRKVALKLIKPGMDTRQVIARFEAERQTFALMDHPNIAKILDAGVTGDEMRYSECGMKRVLILLPLRTPNSPFRIRRAVPTS